METVIPVPPGVDVEAFILALSANNEGIRIEQPSTNKLVVMSPSGNRTSAQNALIIHALTAWNLKGKRGEVYDSNTLFTLPDGRRFGPDAAWISNERAALNLGQTFGLHVPEFVIELLSPSDSPAEAHRKMKIWIENDVQLGWLVNPKDQSIAVYQAGDPQEDPLVITGEEPVFGSGPIAGFQLDFTGIFKP